MTLLMIAALFAAVFTFFTWLVAKAFYDSDHEWNIASPDENPGISAQDRAWLRKQHLERNAPSVPPAPSAGRPVRLDGGCFE